MAPNAGAIMVELKGDMKAYVATMIVACTSPLAYLLQEIEEKALPTVHFFLLDQFFGFFGSLGPSQDTYSDSATAVQRSRSLHILDWGLLEFQSLAVLPQVILFLGLSPQRSSHLRGVGFGLWIL